eukprot:11176709-Ditylum_brightwellii.AAC.1
MLKNHCWECCPKDEERIIEPIHPNSIKELESTTGPDSEAACKQLEAEEGFSYQAANVELIFAYVICCPDIGYAAVSRPHSPPLPSWPHLLTCT